MDPFLDNRNKSLSTSVSNWVYHYKAIKSFNKQETMKIPVFWRVTGFLVINMDCPERDCLVLPFFQRYFVPVFRLWFLVLASQTISSECTYSVEHTRPVVESFCLVVGFCNAHVSAHFIVVSNSEAR